MGQIVVGYDGSACGDAALDSALEIAGELGDSVTVVFGYAPARPLGRRDRRTRGGDRGAGREGDGQGQGARRPSRASRSRRSWCAKRAAEALIEVAEQRDARMIVVGSFGDPPLKGMILGSTPNKLLHLSERPVLVVPAPK